MTFSITKMFQSLEEIKHWLKSSWLKLNLDKMEVMLLKRREKCDELTGTVISPLTESIQRSSVKEVQSHGVFLNSLLLLDTYWISGKEPLIHNLHWLVVSFQINFKRQFTGYI